MLGCLSSCSSLLPMLGASVSLHCSCSPAGGAGYLQFKFWPSAGSLCRVASLIIVTRTHRLDASASTVVAKLNGVCKVSVHQVLVVHKVLTPRHSSTTPVDVSESHLLFLLLLVHLSGSVIVHHLLVVVQQVTALHGQRLVFELQQPGEVNTVQNRTEGTTSDTASCSLPVSFAQHTCLATYTTPNLHSPTPPLQPACDTHTILILMPCST